MLDLIDSHCHFNFKIFDGKRVEILKKCHAMGLKQIIVPAVTAESWQDLLTFCQRFDDIYPALGLHPMFLDKHHPEQLEILKQLIAQEKPLAVGEIGLDFFQKDTDRKLQSQFFQAQLVIAKNAQLPVILHIRKSHDLVIKMLQKTTPRGGICHAFNGTLDQAKKYIEMGFLLGFGGTLTNSNARKIKLLASNIPLSFIALETDAPDMPTQSNKGGVNDSSYILEIVQALAEIRKEPIEVIAQQTSQNVRKLFAID